MSEPLIRNAKTVEESNTGRARQFSRRLKELLQQALALSAKKNKLDAADYTQQVEEPRDELTLHLRDRVLREQPGGAGSAPCGHRTQGLALFPKRTRCTGF